MGIAVEKNTREYCNTMQEILKNTTNKNKNSRHTEKLTDRQYCWKGWREKEKNFSLPHPVSLRKHIFVPAKLEQVSVANKKKGADCIRAKMIKREKTITTVPKGAMEKKRVREKPELFRFEIRTRKSKRRSKKE